MRLHFPARERFERALFLRHLAIGFAAVAACVFQGHVRASNAALWVIGLTAVLNLLLALVAGRSIWVRLSAILSPLVGLVGWTVLVSLTGGVSSVFVAGFWLEIVLSAWTGAPIGILFVTGGAAISLWAQLAVSNTGTPLRSLVLQTFFLGAMGAATLLLTRRWAGANEELSHRQADLLDRLESLEMEIRALRALGEAGERAAGLAHALKNAAHGLRGFVALIEDRHAGPQVRARALEGVRAAIDRVDEIAHLTMARDSSRAAPPDVLDCGEMGRLIEEMIEEVSVSYPRIGWSTRSEGVFPAVQAPRRMVREALLNLARNAAEAMNGTGEVMIETVLADGRIEIRVRDHGSGFGVEDLEKTRMPGFTTKSGGSGFGLFLTRRLVEAHGGRLTATPAAGGGVVIAVGFPHQGPQLRR